MKGLQEVFDRYRQHNHDKREGTLVAKRSAWDQFTQWFNKQTHLEHLRDLSQWFEGNFQDWLRTHDDIDQAELSLRMTLMRVKTVIEFAQSRGYVQQDVPADWDLPSVESDDLKIRSNPLMPERGIEIMDYVASERSYERAYLLWVLVFRYGLRVSAIRAIDKEHVKLAPDGDHPPHLMLRDRPHLGPNDNAGLPLKNKRDEYASRRIPLDSDTVDVIRGYIRYERKEHDDPDKYGRHRLVTTERLPRISKQCIGTRIHALTPPLEYDGECDYPSCVEYLAENGGYPCPSD